MKKGSDHNGLVALAILFLIFAPVDPSMTILVVCLVGGVAAVVFALVEAAGKL